MWICSKENITFLLTLLNPLVPSFGPLQGNTYLSKGSKKCYQRQPRTEKTFGKHSWQFLPVQFYLIKWLLILMITPNLSYTSIILDHSVFFIFLDFLVYKAMKL